MVKWHALVACGMESTIVLDVLGLIRSFAAYTEWQVDNFENMQYALELTTLILANWCRQAWPSGEFRHPQC